MGDGMNMEESIRKSLLRSGTAQDFLDCSGLTVEAGLEVVDQEIERLKEKEKKGDQRKQIGGLKRTIH